jgi:hypothetical protein
MNPIVKKNRPEVANAKIVDDNGNLKSPKTQITLRQLLTHTAGYSYTFFNHKIKAWGEKNSISEFDGKKAEIDQPLIAEVIYIIFNPMLSWSVARLADLRMMG